MPVFPLCLPVFWPEMTRFCPHRSAEKCPALEALLQKEGR